MNTNVYLVVLLASISCLKVADCNYQYTGDLHKRSSVLTSHGYVSGQIETIRVKDGRLVEVDVFWGIPFAKPPLGDLRFRPPVPRDPWDGVLNATTPPNSCIQQMITDDPVIIPNPPTPLSEDCLYLNIWRPRCTDQVGSGHRARQHSENSNRSAEFATGMSTMFWIHGQLYTLGSSTISLYNGANLAASQCVIVVSTNYRLGVLGFLYLGIDKSPGNMGLLDMTMALTWTKENVEKFGGDKSSITVFGESIGASSAGLLTISPLTRNLIKNIILQSGSVASFFAYQSQRSALESAFVFSRKFSCYSDNRTAIVECLKQVDATRLAQGFLELVQGFSNLMTAVVDGYFLTQSPLEALQNKGFRPTDILLGTTKDEGTFPIFFIWPDEYNFRDRRPPRVLKDQELDEKLTTILSLAFRRQYIPQILPDIKTIYQLDQLRRQVSDATLTLLNAVFTDLPFKCPARLQADKYVNVSQNVYLFSFNYFPKTIRLPVWVGATHQLEIPFVFGNTVPDVPEFSRRETDLIETIMTYWANFAKFGNPSPRGTQVPRWPRYRPQDPRNILLFTESARVEVGRAETRSCDYWNSLPRAYFRD